VWIPASEQGARVVGSWNGWAGPGLASEIFDDGWLVVRLALPPGEHGYLIEHRGARELDAFNPLTTFAGESEVSLLLVGDCSVPAIVLQQVETTGPGEVTIVGTFVAASGGTELDPQSVRAESSTGGALGVEQADPDSGQLVVRASGLERGRHVVRLAASDDSGTAAEAPQAAVWIDPAHAQWSDAVLYQVMLDRFRGDGGAALGPPPNPGARAGGTLDGLRAEIESGFFGELGVTALWLSPVYENPVEAQPGNDGHPYESYHGYWPQGSLTVDERLGGRAALEAVLRAAQQRGLRVLLDLVPNHVYQSNPRYLEHQGDGWFNPAGCVCGAPDCPWSTHMQTCWFTSYLPDVRWQNADARRRGIDDALWWTGQFGLDGVRIDAVPMMPRLVSRRIAHAMRATTFPRSASFLLGEVYTGPGSYGTDEMRRHLGPDGLDSLFDFPLMWALRDAIGSGTGSFEMVEQILVYGEQSFAGSGAVLGLMLDNHDTPRFVSVANGDAFNDPWSAPAATPVWAEPYLRLRLALGVTFTLPGMPVLFQGDELGLPGAGDPDSRRVMPDVEQLSAWQLEVRDRVRRLGGLRACSSALRRGDRQALVATEQSYVYLRGSAEPFPVVVALSTSSAPTEVVLEPGAVPDGAYVDLDTGDDVSVAMAGQSPLPLEPLSLRMLVRSDDPCR
jgi:glycosidase